MWVEGCDVPQPRTLSDAGRWAGERNVKMRVRRRSQKEYIEAMHFVNAKD